MPEISRFFGIVIRMYFDDHNPPHFHATYEGKEAQFSIETQALLAGTMSRRAQGLVTEWAKLHTTELTENWRRLHGNQPANRVEPLE